MISDCFFIPIILVLYNIMDHPCFSRSVNMNDQQFNNKIHQLLDCEDVEDELDGHLVVDDSNADPDYVISNVEPYEDLSSSISDEDDVVLEETFGEANIRNAIAENVLIPPFSWKG